MPRWQRGGLWHRSNLRWRRVEDVDEGWLLEGAQIAALQLGVVERSDLSGFSRTEEEEEEAALLKPA